MIKFIIIVVVYVFLLILTKKLYMKYDDKNISKIISNKEFEKINEKLKDNENICNDILNDINAKNVKVLINENEKSTNSFYNILNNSIILCNNSEIKKSPFRLLFISHECHHSVQDKKMLWFNFILANINIIYSVITIVLILLNIIQKQYYSLFFIILLIINIFSFLARIIIEADATYMSVNISRNYAKKFLDIDELEKLILEFEKMISNGFSTFVYSLILNNVPMILIYLVILIIKSI